MAPIAASGPFVCPTGRQAMNARPNTSRACVRTLARAHTGLRTDRSDAVLQQCSICTGERGGSRLARIHCARAHTHTVVPSDRMLIIIYVGFAPEKEEDMENLFQDITNEQRWDGHHSWQASFLAGGRITINMKHKFSDKSSLKTFQSKVEVAKNWPCFPRQNHGSQSGNDKWWISLQVLLCQHTQEVDLFASRFLASPRPLWHIQKVCVHISVHRYRVLLISSHACTTRCMFNWFTDNEPWQCAKGALSIFNEPVRVWRVWSGHGWRAHGVWGIVSLGDDARRHV